MLYVTIINKDSQLKEIGLGIVHKAFIICIMYSDIQTRNGNISYEKYHYSDDLRWTQLYICLNAYVF